MATSPRSTPMKATCHCGAVVVEVPRLPREINECQCSICRRYGVAWGYYELQEVKISVASSSPIRKYAWGDCKIEFVFCSVCGCVTHWQPIEKREFMGVNTRMMNPNDLRTVNRILDFEQLSAPVRSKETAHPDDKADYQSSV